MPSKFKFYEVVQVASFRDELREINGKKGAILGMVEDENGDWFYSVAVLDEEISYATNEDDLISTGEMMTREDFYDGTSITVLVDPETGEGSLKE